MVAFLATDSDAPAEATARSRRRPRIVGVVAGDDLQVCSRCEVAESTIARMRGLLGRDGLAPGEGMFINPAPSVMTFFMRFPIDVVFVDRKYTIVKVVHSLGAWKTAGARKAAAALELPAGTAASVGLEAGMTLRLVDEGAAP